MENNVERLEILEEYAERQQWYERPESHVGSAAAAAAELRPRGSLAGGCGDTPCSPAAVRTAHYAMPGLRPAPRLADESVALTRRRRTAGRPRCTFTTPRMQSTHIFASRSDKCIGDASGLWQRIRANLTANEEESETAQYNATATAFKFITSAVAGAWRPRTLTMTVLLYGALASHAHHSSYSCRLQRGKSEAFT